MTTPLTPEQIAALQAQEDHRAIAEGIAQMEAGKGRPLDEAFADLQKRLGFDQEADRQAIAAGIAQMEAGDIMPLDEAFAEIRAELGIKQP